MADVIYLRGEGGLVIAHDLPLSDNIADKMTKGYLRQVNADGSPYTEPGGETTPVMRPLNSAPKAEWVGWAVHNGVSPDDAEAMTKTDLIDTFGE